MSPCGPKTMARMRVCRGNRGGFDANGVELKRSLSGQVRQVLRAQQAPVRQVLLQQWQQVWQVQNHPSTRHQKDS